MGPQNVGIAIWLLAGRPGQTRNVGRAHWRIGTTTFALVIACLGLRPAAAGAETVRATVGAASHFLTDSCGGDAKTPISFSGAFYLLTELPLRRVDGNWVAESVTKTGTASPGLGTSTVTSTLSAAGIVTSTEKGSYAVAGLNGISTVDGISTLDLKTGDFVWCRTIVHPAPIGVETQFRRAILPVTLTPITDIPAYIDSVELTQAIQQWQPLAVLRADLAADREPPVPIIAGKGAALRIYLRALSLLPRVTLEVTGAITATGSNVVVLPCSIEQQRRQTDRCRSVDFYFVPPAGNFDIRVQLKNHSGAVLETHDLPLTARMTKTLKLKAVSVCDGSSPRDCGDPTALSFLAAFLRKIAPTSWVDVEMTGERVVVPSFPQYDPSDSGPELDWWQAVNAGLVWRYWANPTNWLSGALANTMTKYYGMVRSSGQVHFLGAAANIPSSAAASFSNPVLDTTVAHEVGHTLALRHTVTDLPQTNCHPSSDALSTWPYADNRLQSGPAGNPQLEVGFDVTTGTALAAEATFELMGYCDSQWISPRHYRLLVQALSTTTGPIVPEPAAAAPAWLIAGTIELGRVEFEPLFTMLSPPSDGSGSHALEVLDGGGTVIASTRFTPLVRANEASGSDPDGVLTFATVVPRPAGAVSLVLRSDTNEVLSTLTISGVVPTVQLISPAVSSVLAGELPLTWSIADADSSTHTTRVQYSPDNGITWSELGAVDNRQLLVNFDELPGSATSLIRLMVSDGINSSTAEFGPFTTAKKTTVSARILSPEPNTIVAPRLLFLEGVGLDIDDGVLTGAALTWSSDIVGALGTGERIAVNLPMGRHVIELTATDSDANTARDTVTVVVAGPAPVVSLAVQPLNTPTTCVAATISVATPGLPPTIAEYSVNGGAAWVPVPLGSLPFRLILPGSGAITVLARVFDAAGQMTADSRQVTTTATCATVTPANWAAPTTGGTQTIALTSPLSTLPWTAFTDQPWLSVAPANGVGPANIMLTAAATTSIAARTATAWVAGQPVSVTQAAGTPAFTIAPTSWTAPISGGTRTITVTSNLVDAPWTASSSEAWLTLSATAGVGSASLTLTAAPSPGETRTATATIAGHTVSVTQTTAVPYDLRVANVVGNLVTLRWSWSGPPPTGFIVAGGVQSGQILATLPTGSANPIYTFTAPTGAFFVRVFTAEDTSFERPSNEVPLVVNLPVAPSAPANLLAAIDGNRLDLAWTNTFGGGAPDSVTLQVAGTLTGSFPLGSGEGFSFTSVPPGTYTIALVATNGGGVSDPSNPLTLTFPGGCSGAPLPPSRFLAFGLGRTAFVVWEPAETGPAPTGFVINVAELGLNVPTAARGLSGTVGPGTYTLAVQATNACGASAFTPAQSLVVP